MMNSYSNFPLQTKKSGNTLKGNTMKWFDFSETNSYLAKRLYQLFIFPLFMMMQTIMANSSKSLPLQINMNPRQGRLEGGFLPRLIAVFGLMVMFALSGWGADFKINDVSITESDAGYSDLTFTVTLDSYCRRNTTYSVDWKTADDTATVSDSDYTSSSGTVTYTIGNSNISSGTCATINVTVPIRGDTKVEGNEQFFVNLTNPGSSSYWSTAQIVDSQGRGEILNDDFAPPVVTPVTFTVDETAVNGTVVGTVSATNSPASFSITAGDSAGVFGISPTGVITIADNTTLDYETTPSYSLTVSASNGVPPDGTATITVNLNDITGPLITPDQTFSTPSSFLTGATVGKVLTTGTTPTAFAISGGNTDGYFTIDNFGDITLALDTPALGTYTLTIAASNSEGTDSKDVTVVVMDNQLPVAVDDSATTLPSATVTGNVLENDTDPDGDTLTVSNSGTYTLTYGTLVIQEDGSFAYNSGSTINATDIFTYTISDGNGGTASAELSILIGDTQVSSGFHAFELINPEDTRNIIGNYVMIGNTVECLEFNSNHKCSTKPEDKNDDSDVTPRYINIDASAGKTNSSSANFTLPPEYDPTVGIMWVGLFWQGSIGIGTQNNAKLIDMKIDNNAYINDIRASTIYYTPGSDSTHYAGFADVTQKFKDANLLAGKHTVTVADIYTDDGGGGAEDNYGGWSLVVIYKHTGADAKAYNISVYNGWAALYSTANPKTEETATITGFKLPITGTVDATFSAFAGEGELDYGGSYNDRDSMSISADGTNWTSVGTSPYNVFDSALSDTISRDNVRENFQVNNDGIDVEDYNVSSIMTGYRDANPTIDTVKVRLEAYEDRVNISMMAFATELYKPRVCYEEKIFKITDNGDGTFTETEILQEGAQVNYDDEIRTKVLVQNDSSEVAEKVSITRATGQETVLPYLAGKTYYDNNNPADFDSITLTHATEAHDTDLFSFISGVFSLNLGENATSDVGGDLIPLAVTPTGNQKQRAYFEYSTNIQSEDNVSFAYFVSYKNDALNLTFTNEVLPKCTDFNNSFWGRAGNVVFSAGFGVTDPWRNYYSDTAHSRDLSAKVANRPFELRGYNLNETTGEPESYDGLYKTQGNKRADMVAFLSVTDDTCTVEGEAIGQVIIADGTSSGIATRFDIPASTGLTITKASKVNRIKMRVLDWRDILANAGDLTCGVSALGGNYIYVPQCLSSIQHIKEAFDPTTVDVCTNPDNVLVTNGVPACDPDNYASGAKKPEVTITPSEYNYDAGCAMCLADAAATFTTCSADNFSVRPNDFAFDASANVIQSNDVGIVLSQAGTHPVSSANKLRSGEDYNMTIFARDYNGVLGVKDYNQSTNNLGAQTRHYLYSAGTLVQQDPVTTLNDVNITNTSYAGQFFDGNTTQFVIRYDDVGIVDLDLNDSNWGAIDATDTVTVEYTPAVQTGVTYTAVSQPGRVVYSSTATPLRMTVKPYDFDISAANLFDNNNPSGFTYLSDDMNMSARLPITVNARNKSGGITQNYSDSTQGLYEQLANFVLAVDNTAYPATLTLVPDLPANANLPFENGTAVVGEDDENVTKFNFDRSTNIPVNPFRVDGSDVNLSITDTDNVYGEANETFLGNATFVYGRSHMARTRAMCSGSPCTGTVTFYYEFYGDKDANTTLITALLAPDAPKRSIDSVNWYQNTKHVTGNGDGNVTSASFNIPPNAATGTYQPVYTQYTSNSSAALKYDGFKGFPYKATIELSSPANTQSWLIYDKYNVATPRNSGQLEYYGPGSWTSTTDGAETTVKDTGTTNRNQNTNRRIKW